MSKGKRFAVFDIDGTLIRWQLYHAVADKLVALGFIAPVKFQQIRDARMVWKRRESTESFKDYELELVRLYSDILTEITPEQFEQAAQTVFEEYRDQVYIYTRDLIRDLKKDGYLVFAISGSQKTIIAKLATYYGFDDFVARDDEIEDGRFTGKSTTPIFSKDQVLKELAKKHGCGFRDSVGVGDSLSDAKMLELVQQPIAFNPELELFKKARQNGWQIVIERKNVIYKLKGEDGAYVLA